MNCDIPNDENRCTECLDGYYLESYPGKCVEIC